MARTVNLQALIGGVLITIPVEIRDAVSITGQEQVHMVFGPDTPALHSGDHIVLATTIDVAPED